MKEDLLILIDCKDEIELELYGCAKANVNSKFRAWKEELICELKEIYEIAKKKSKAGVEWEALILLKGNFDGCNDKEDFYTLSGKLNYIKNNIDKYYPEDVNEKNNIDRYYPEYNYVKNDRFSIEMNLSSSKENANSKKDSNLKSKIFISHSIKDIEYANSFVELLEDIGLKEHIIYTSIPEYGIPLNEDIYDYLKKQFQNYKLHVIYMLSNNFYNSTACLNEMGAALILSNKYTTILLPNFEYKNIEGAVNPRQIGLKFDDDLTTVKDRLGELKDNLTKEFELPSISHSSWERKRDKFIDEINQLKASMATNHN